MPAPSTSHDEEYARGYARGLAAGHQALADQQARRAAVANEGHNDHYDDDYQRVINLDNSSDDLDPRDTSLVKKEENNDTSICLLVTAAIIIVPTVIWAPSSDKYMNYDEQQNFKYNHVTNYDCPNFDSNSHLLSFLLAVNVANLVQRMVGKYLYEKRGYDFKKIYPFLYWYYHGSYGVWTVVNIVEFFHLPLHCKKISVWSMWLWEVACFIGLKSCCIGGFGLVMAIFVLPCMWYSDRRDERERNAE